jgi:fatty acid-binding protein DegV
MSKVAIVTDSTASVPSELKKQYGIATVPLLLHLDNKTYRDAVDIKTPAELFQLNVAIHGVKGLLTILYLGG